MGGTVVNGKRREILDIGRRGSGVWRKVRKVGQIRRKKRVSEKHVDARRFLASQMAENFQAKAVPHGIGSISTIYI